MKSFLLAFALIATISIGYPGTHVGNGMVAEEDLVAAWQNRGDLYQQLIQSGELDANEKKYIETLIKNKDKEKKKLQFADKAKFNGAEGFYVQKSKVGEPIVFNKKKLAKKKKNNKKDALLLILEAQSKRHKSKVDFGKLKTKIAKAIK